VSTARPVPETYELTGDDAWETLSRTGRGRLLADAFRRLRFADGFSHARSLALLMTLVFMQGLIALVGLASTLGESEIGRLIARTLEAAAPGPAGKVLTQAVTQANQAGGSSPSTALWVGLIGALITGTTAMGQFERGVNRIYGVEQDRPTSKKYGRALLLAITAGVLGSAAFASLAFGRAVADSLNSDLATTLWNTLRWPVALALTAATIALMLRWSPRRHQPGWSWLAFGAVVAVVLWAVSTLLLAWFFQWSSTFGQTYGPLAGIVALMVWAMLSSISVLYGTAVAAQLEAVRSGDPAVQLPRTETARSVPSAA
jgi:YihY family inner membrane protein